MIDPNGVAASRLLRPRWGRFICKDKIRGCASRPPANGLNPSGMIVREASLPRGMATDVGYTRWQSLGNCRADTNSVRLMRDMETSKSLTSQSLSPWRQFLLLLATLIPLLFALRWVAAKFPTSTFDAWTCIFRIEPERLLFIESYHSRFRYHNVRVFVIDTERESMNEILSPPDLGPMWYEVTGIDLNGNVICRVRTDKSDEYFCCSPKSLKVLPIHATGTGGATLIGKRFLSRVVGMNESKYFLWNDLTELGFPPHQKQLDDSVVDHLVAIPESNSFYWISRDNPQSAQPAEDDETSSEAMAIDDSESLEMLDFEEVGPPTPAPDETLVLMGMSPEGPYEIARWPVVGGSGNATCEVGDGCIGCISMDGKFINIHDALTGSIRHQIVIPQTAIDVGLRNLNWRMYVSFVSLHDGAGACTTHNIKTGAAFDTTSSLQGLVIGSNDDEYLTLLLKKNLDDWPGMVEIRSSKSGQVLHAWTMPDSHMGIGWPIGGNVQFSPDGHEITFVTQDGRVLVVDKSTCKIVRNIRPRFWIPYLTSLAAIGMLIWGLCWIRLSIRMGFSYWFDTLVFVLLTCLFLWWRITLSGCFAAYERPAWSCVAALPVAVWPLVIHQTLYVRKTLFRRALPSLAFAAVVFATIQFTADQAWMAKTLSTYAAIVGAIVLLGSIWTHRICPPFLPCHTVPQRQPRNDYKFSLKHLLLITTACGVVMAILRWIDWKSTLEIVMREGAMFAIIGCTVLSLYCVVHYRGIFWIKSIFLTALFVVAILSFCDRQEWWYSPTFEMVSQLAASIAILGFATILVASPITLRQRRLSNT